MDWIEKNKGSPDFEEELFIVAQQAKPSAFAGMSKEEKLAKVKEIQTAARMKRIKEEAA